MGILQLLKKGIYFCQKGIYYVRYQPIMLDEKNLERMLMSIPGWLEKGHIYCMDYAIKNLPDNSPIVEIGTFEGLSSNVILYFLKKYNKSNRLYTTDWYFNDINATDRIVHLKDPRSLRQFIKDSFVRNISFFNPEANVQSSDHSSDDFFEAWKNKTQINNLFGGTFCPSGSIAFAYIDGNHVYDFAKRDFENVDKLLVKGGYILFDDSADYTFRGSKKVAQEATKTGRYRLIKKNPHYFIQKI